MSISTALTTAPKLYEPTFNPTTNTYEDACPWPKHWRGQRETHKCFCNAKVTFSTRAVFKQHIDSGKHKEALKEYNTEKDETKQQEKEFRIKIDKLEREKNRALKENSKSYAHIERQTVIITDHKQKISKLKKKNNSLKDKNTENIEYIEILEAESKEQRSKISELEEYIKIMERRYPPPPPPPPSSPEEKDEEWYDLSEDED